MTRSRARQSQEERADTQDADTLARRTARARGSQGERADTQARRTARARQSQGERADTQARRTARARQSQGERADTLARRTARARQSQGERADMQEADTLARRTTRARQSQGERADMQEADTLARRTARARESQGERADTQEADTLARRTARARQPAVQLYYCHALMIIYNLTVKCVLPFRCTSDVQAKRASYTSSKASGASAATCRYNIYKKIVDKSPIGKVSNPKFNARTQYQFLHTKQRRHELVVLELYETHTNQSQ